MKAKRETRGFEIVLYSVSILLLAITSWPDSSGASDVSHSAAVTATALQDSANEPRPN